MNFYTFSANCSTRYVSVIDILNSSEMSFGSCDKCGADKLVKWGNVIPKFECEAVTKNRVLPDIMLYGGRMLQSFKSWEIVSENVKQLFDDEKLTGASFYPAEIVYKQRGEYKKLDKQYFIMEILGKAEIDFKAMGVKCSLCELCGHFVFEGPLCPLFVKKGLYPTIIKKASWDGSDVFNNNDCTERFVKSILKSGLLGFEFIDYKQKYYAFDKKIYFKTIKEFNKISTLNEKDL